MGSGNSSPIKRAHSVETEDALEIRFDQMAMGGTAAMIIIAVIVIYLACKKLRQPRRRARELTNQGMSTPAPMAATFPPWYPAPFIPPAMPMAPPPWIPMDSLALRAEFANATRYHHDTRFIELPTETAGHSTQKPSRPPPITRCGLPSPKAGQQPTSEAT